MSQGNFGLAAGMIVIAILGTGCAATRSEVKLASPVAAPASTGPATGKVVVIRSVTDARVFEQAPRDPSVPSLGGEGAGNASADTKARAIGRKFEGARNVTVQMDNAPPPRGEGQRHQTRHLLPQRRFHQSCHSAVPVARYQRPRPRRVPRPQLYRPRPGGEGTKTVRSPSGAAIPRAGTHATQM